MSAGFSGAAATMSAWVSSESSEGSGSGVEKSGLVTGAVSFAGEIAGSCGISKTDVQGRQDIG